MMKLLVIANHPPEKWSQEQREGWDIEYVPFPNVPPSASIAEIMPLRNEVVKVIKNWLEANPGGKICFQGEFSLFCYVLECLFKTGIPADSFVFPTTERVVKEREKEDGTVEKTYQFRFVRWR